MDYKVIVFFLLTFMVKEKVHAQLNASLESNAQWYIDDDKVQLSNDESEERLRANSYLRLDYLKGNWSFVAQVESYEPISLLNYNPDFKGTNIGTVYAEYNFEDIDLEIGGGHLYEQFGSGLILRTWEDRQLGINNSILGGRIKYDPFEEVSLTLLAGKQRIGMGFDLSDGFIYAGNIETNLSRIFKLGHLDLDLGLSYVGRYQDIKKEYSNAPELLNAYSARLNLVKSNIYFGAEYVYKENDLLVELGNIFNDIKNPGSALRFNMGYTQRGLGVDINLRRMENMGFYSQENLLGNQYNQGILNYIPALTKQYDYALQNIYVYQAQPSLVYFQRFKAGEIGGQIDLFYNIKRKTAFGGKYGTKIALNASYFAGLKGGVNLENQTYNVDFLAFGEKYYNDLGIELRKKWSKNWSSVFMYLNQYYDRSYVEDTYGEIKTHVATGETTYKFGKGQSIRLEAQHQWADEGFKNWAGGTLEYGLNHNWSVYIHDIYNYGNDDSAEQIHYYNTGLSFSKNATRIAVSYGRQRGGLLCVGGICRVVSEAAGLTVNISTSF